MGHARRFTTASLILVFLLGGLVQAWRSVRAQTPNRQTTIVVPYTEHEWWLIRWEDNSIQCRILVDHEGLPQSGEVLTFCGSELHAEWQTTPACTITDAEAGTSTCEGLYLHLVSSQPRERDVIIELPPPVVYVSLEGCSPIPPENRCTEMPSLLLTAEEPLPNEQITFIEGFIDGRHFLCEGERCTLELFATPIEGVLVEFWAHSSYGDQSERYTAQVRVVDTGVSNAPGSGGWYVDVISSQWLGEQLATCARIWNAFSPVGTPPSWLSTPTEHELLASGEPYFYLAGRLIAQGAVDVSACPTGGLLPNGYADACGLEKARPMVEEWQNMFDARLVEVAQETGVPGQLMKNLFAQESQFWPGVFRVPYEFGLGQITDHGVEPLLLWNKSFYEQFCPLVLAEDACAEGYLGLNAEHRALLRGALATQVNADCAECPLGIDLTNVDFSLSFFAQTLQANCEQVAQIVYNASNQIAGSVSTYEDLWRFTIANYHAGPGCVSYAIHSAWQTSDFLTWDHVSTQFTEACQGAVPYVEKITEYRPPGVDVGEVEDVPSPFETPPSGQATPPLQPTPTVDTYPGPQQTPTVPAYPPPLPTPTTGPYPYP